MTIEISNAETSAADRILAMADAPLADPNAPAPLTAAEKRSCEEASKRAYHTARAANASVKEATDAAEAAYRAELASLRAPAIKLSEVISPLPARVPPMLIVADAPAPELLCFDCGSPIEPASSARYEVDPEVERSVPKCDRCAMPREASPRDAALPIRADAPRLTEALAYAEQAPVAEGTLDKIGEARSTADRDAARAAGWSPAETVYTRGFRVVELGVENARAERLAHAEKPTIGEVCDGIIAKIAAEDRRAIPAIAHQIGMNPRDGALRFNGEEMPISEPAFGSLVSRLGYGGAGYLGKCPLDLRAENVNRWSGLLLGQHEKALHEHAGKDAQDGKVTEAPAPRELALRTRLAASGKREVFAAVTKSYTAFDIDKIAEAVKLATPAEARATVTYDGYRSQIDIAFHSNVQPKHYVAGEFFKAGVRIRTADDGSGSARGSSTLFQNLCLNLIIIDAGARDLFRIRHTGSIESLAAAFREGFAKALKSIEHFLTVWGYACEEAVVERARAIDAETPADPREALPGLFRGLIAEKTISLPGREIEAHVSALVRLWEADESGAKQVHEVSRASIVNAITRYAHVELPSFDDPFASDQLEREASALLWGARAGREPSPLVWLASDAVGAAK